LNHKHGIWHNSPVGSAQISEDQARALVKRIRQLGREAGLDSDRKIAKEAGMAHDALSKLETGGDGPTLGRLLALCGAVKAYSFDELLGPSPVKFFDQKPAIDALLARPPDDRTGEFYGILESGA
jgi:transcriptional regulator with XRE-family HTH domain